MAIFGALHARVRRLLFRLTGEGFAGRDEHAYPGLRMLVLPEAEACRRRPGADEVCISIVSPGRPAAPLPQGYVDVLRLDFHDTSPYARPHAAAQALTAAQADAVVAFVERHRARRRLVLHCSAGLSRSRSMAAALASAFGLPYRWTAINPDVVSAIEAAAARRRAPTVRE
jgi:predicted protein tyrosine phosphatase